MPTPKDDSRYLEEFRTASGTFEKFIRVYTPPAESRVRVKTQAAPDFPEELMIPDL